MNFHFTRTVLAVLAFVITSVLPLELRAQTDQLKVTKAELQDILEKAREIGSSLNTAFGSSDPLAFKPELLEHFQRPGINQEVLEGQQQFESRLKRIVKRKKRNKCRRIRKKRRERLSLMQADALAGGNCSTLCAWAAAWAQASCFAVACAECPGGTFRVCASFTATAYGFGVGVACVNVCDDVPTDPIC